MNNWDILILTTHRENVNKQRGGAAQWPSRFCTENINTPTTISFYNSDLLKILIKSSDKVTIIIMLIISLSLLSSHPPQFIILYSESLHNSPRLYGRSIRENLGGVFQIILELRFNNFGSISGNISLRSGDMGFKPNIWSIILAGIANCWFASFVLNGSRLHAGGGGNLFVLPSSSVESSLRSRSQP